MVFSLVTRYYDYPYGPLPKSEATAPPTLRLIAEALDPSTTKQFSTIVTFATTLSSDDGQYYARFCYSRTLKPLTPAAFSDLVHAIDLFTQQQGGALEVCFVDQLLHTLRANYPTLKGIEPLSITLLSAAHSFNTGVDLYRPHILPSKSWTAWMVSAKPYHPPVYVFRSLPSRFSSSEPEQPTDANTSHATPLSLTTPCTPAPIIGSAHFARSATQLSAHIEQLDPAALSTHTLRHASFWRSSYQYHPASMQTSYDLRPYRRILLNALFLLCLAGFCCAAPLLLTPGTSQLVVQVLSVITICNIPLAGYFLYQKSLAEPVLQFPKCSDFHRKCLTTKATFSKPAPVRNQQSGVKTPDFHSTTQSPAGVHQAP